MVAAHDLRFDRRLLSHEFDRAGIDVDWGDGLYTLRAVGCKLDAACADYGIHLHGAHRALNDARATAQLLPHLLAVRRRPLRWSTPLRPLGGSLSGRYRPRESLASL